MSQLRTRQHHLVLPWGVVLSFLVGTWGAGRVAGTLRAPRKLRVWWGETWDLRAEEEARAGPLAESLHARCARGLDKYFGPSFLNHFHLFLKVAYFFPDYKSSACLI